MVHFRLVILSFIALAGTTLSYGQQIDVDTILDAIAADSPYPRDNYRRYSRKLSQTLAMLDAEQLGRVFQQQTTVDPTVDPDPPQDVPNIYDEISLGKKNYFRRYKAEMSPEGMAELDKVADYLKANPQYNILIRSNTGHDDQQLSDDRAKAGLDYLVSLGIPASRIQTFSNNDNDVPDQEGRKLRGRTRLEFELLPGN